MKRIAVVVNKWWEAEGVLNAMLHQRSRPPALPWPTFLCHPRERPVRSPLPPETGIPTPRAVFSLPRASVGVWCVSDLLEHLADSSQFQSSSQRKAEHLPKAFAHTPDFVIAIGTAAHPGSENGRVMVGTRVFMHNYHPNGSNEHSDWRAGPFDQVLDSYVPEAVFAAATTFDASVPSKFIPTPNLPATPVVSALFDGVALCTVNVTDPKEYGAADNATIAAYKSTGCASPVMSIETTHGVIRAMSQAPFVFVSGIVNQVGQFATEVKPNEYSQNHAAAHNAGVVVAAMLPLLDGAI